MRPGSFNFPKDWMCKQPVRARERKRERESRFPFFYLSTVHLETLTESCSSIPTLLPLVPPESGNLSRYVRVAVRSDVFGWICAMGQARSCYSKKRHTHHHCVMKPNPISFWVPSTAPLITGLPVTCCPHADSMLNN